MRQLSEPALERFRLSDDTEGNKDFAMGTMKRGDDAQDHAPQPTQRKTETPGQKQEAGNYEERTGGDGSIAVEDLSSADDEGAN